MKLKMKLIKKLKNNFFNINFYLFIINYLIYKC